MKWLKPRQVTGNYVIKENSKLGDLLFKFNEPCLSVKKTIQVVDPVM